MMAENVRFKELVATFNPADIALIRSLLEANEIIFHIEGENFMHVRPLVAPAKIWVDETRIDDARALLKDFKSGKFGFQVD